MQRFLLLGFEWRGFFSMFCFRLFAICFILSVNVWNIQVLLCYQRKCVMPMHKIDCILQGSFKRFINTLCAINSCKFFRISELPSARKEPFTHLSGCVLRVCMNAVNYYAAVNDIFEPGRWLSQKITTLSCPSRTTGNNISLMLLVYAVHWRLQQLIDSIRIRQSCRS